MRGALTLRGETRPLRRDHPRMCGEHQAWRFCRGDKPGSSPHVRGAQVAEARESGVEGIIPACAGSTKRERNIRVVEGDHPRMCGEHLASQTHVWSRSGSSPHVRGARGSIQCRSGDAGIIPACAGSTPNASGSIRAVGDHPRMCGEHLELQAPLVHLLGIIPACAGSTRQSG